MAFSSTVKIVITTVGVLGFLFCMLGGVMFAYFPTLMENKIAENLALTETSESFNKWKNPPISANQAFYFFNVTNPDEVNTKYAKPKLQEFGPYVFKVVQIKDVLKWDKDNGRVFFTVAKAYVFQPHLSIGDMSQEYFTLNMPYVGIGTFLTKKISEDLLPYVFADLNANFRNMSIQIIEKHTVAEMLFQGYYVKLLDFMTEYADSFGMTLPQILPNNTFGLYYGRNATEKNFFSIGTGTEGRKDLGKIYTYNNKTNLPFWKGEYCNMINGSDGTQFQPGFTKNEMLYVFSSDICRSLPLEFAQEVEVKGIPAYRYIVPKKAFQGPAINEDNKCFCYENGCMKTGVLRVSSCRKGAPIALSPPHLMDADVSYSKKLIGLKPDNFFHQTFLDIEPSTGIVLNAARRVQVNFHIQKVPGLLHLQNMDDVIFPIYWLAETGQIDDRNAELFKSKVIMPKRIGEAVLLGAIVLGAFAIVSAFLIAMRHVSRKKVVVAASNEVLHFKQGVPMK